MFSVHLKIEKKPNLTSKKTKFNIKAYDVYYSFLSALKPEFRSYSFNRISLQRMCCCFNWKLIHDNLPNQKIYKSCAKTALNCAELGYNYSALIKTFFHGKS